MGGWLNKSAEGQMSGGPVDGLTEKLFNVTESYFTQRNVTLSNIMSYHVFSYDFMSIMSCHVLCTWGHEILDGWLSGVWMNGSLVRLLAGWMVPGWKAF